MKGVKMKHSSHPTYEMLSCFHDHTIEKSNTEPNIRLCILVSRKMVLFVCTSKRFWTSTVFASSNHAI